ncbi:hypothetical protein BDB01DRAFT_772564 [Pilobolus umbonatus]|nr:hypothetical protein BDB01DRAFT_772564 [Pilobolus umbonatus]
MVYQDRDLDAYSYVTLAIFLLVIILVIRPVKIRIGRIKIYLNISTVPPLGVLILLLSQAIDMNIIKNGFLGTIGVKPWAVLILFYSLAYICISLDMTGVFQFCAFWVSKKAGNRGMLAFTLFFILTTLMSGLASNDVVILTGTVFLAYFTKVSDIRPTAFLMSEFTTANIASMALYIGNPTNVVVSEAYNISFITYSAWMLLPTVVCILLAYIVLRIIFHSDYYLPRHIQPPEEEPRSVLIDPHGAVFGIAVLALCLLTLVGTSFAHVPVWMVTLPFAVVMFLRDLRYDLRQPLKRMFNVGKRIPKMMLATSTKDDLLVSEAQEIQLDTIYGMSTVQSMLGASKSATYNKSDTEVPVATGSRDAPEVDISEAYSSSTRKQGDAGTIVIEAEESLNQEPQMRYRSTVVDAPYSPTILTENSEQSKKKFSLLYRGLRWFKTRFPTIHAICVRLPWSILPFSFGMFILVEALAYVGWVGIFATAMSVFAKNYVTAVFGMVFVSILACQILNNLPMTILFTQIIQHKNFTSHVTSEATMQGFLLGLIAGSNLGACLTYVGSLAGIMFEHILKTKSIYILGYFQFLKWNLIILPVIATGVCAVIIGEIWFIYLR